MSLSSYFINKVNVCGMEESHKKKGKYEAYTTYTEIEVSRRDTYPTLARKSAEAVGLDEERKLALFKPTIGARIPDEVITLHHGVKVPWSIGSYLQRARKGADKVCFGVGIFEPLQAQVGVCIYILICS